MVIALLCQLAEARQPRRGYRGFLEWSGSVRRETVGKWVSSESLDTYRKNTLYEGFSTSHGYQINPKFFVGAGLGAEHCADINGWIIPLFLQGRIDMKFGRFTPYGDIKAGVNVGSGIGAYFSPTIGYRFNWGRKMGVNAGLGLTLAGLQVAYYDVSQVDPNLYFVYYIETRRYVKPYFSFRVGIDF